MLKTIQYSLVVKSPTSGIRAEFEYSLTHGSVNLGNQFTSLSLTQFSLFYKMEMIIILNS